MFLLNVHDCTCTKKFYRAKSKDGRFKALVDSHIKSGFRRDNNGLSILETLIRKLTARQLSRKSNKEESIGWAMYCRVFIRHRRSENFTSTTQNSLAKFRSFPERALLFHNNSPVTLHCSHATTIILNENPGTENG